MPYCSGFFFAKAGCRRLPSSCLAEREVMMFCARRVNEPKSSFEVTFVNTAVTNASCDEVLGVENIHKLFFRVSPGCSE